MSNFFPGFRRLSRAGCFLLVLSGGFIQAQTPDPVAVVSENLSAATEMVAYSQQLEASGGIPPYTWAIAGGVRVWDTSGDVTPAEVAGVMDIIDIDAHSQHGMALRADGTILQWGGSSNGQTEPPDNLTGVVSISQGKNHRLVALQDGTVVGWGATINEILPVPAGLTDVVSVQALGDHSLALKADGSVVTWGNPWQSTLTVPADLPPAHSIEGGARFSLAVHMDGTVTAWGNPSYYQNMPGNLSGIVGISGANFRQLVWKADGTLQGWSLHSPVPNDLPPISFAAHGEYHALALDSEGALHGWGGTDEELWSSPVDADRFFMVKGNSLTTVGLLRGQAPEGLELSTGGILSGHPLEAGTYAFRILVRDARGKVAHRLLTLTVAENPNQPPVLESVSPSVATLNTVADNKIRMFSVQASDPDEDPLSYSWTLDGIPVGTDSPEWEMDGGNMVLGSHTVRCTVSDGIWNTVYADWDTLVYRARIELTRESLPAGREMDAYAETLTSEGGIPSVRWHVAGGVWARDTGDWSPLPDVDGLIDVAAAAAGDSHQVVLRANGTVTGFGGNNVWVPWGMSDVIEVAAGRTHSVALTRQGQVYVWGDDTLPAVPPDLPPVRSIAAGDSFTLALLRDGTVRAWGKGSPVPPWIYSYPAEATDGVAVAAGSSHWMMLKADGTVVVKGSDLQPPEGLTQVVAVSAGTGTCLALRQDGTVVAWGSHTVVPENLNRVVAIASYHLTHAALDSDGNWSLWNSEGEVLLPEELPSGVDLALGKDQVLLLQNGELPAGLALETDTGLLQGTPTQGGSSSAAFVCRDAGGQIDFRSFPLQIDALSNRPPVIASSVPETSQIQWLTAGEESLFSVTATDPEGLPLTYVWSVNGIPVGGNDSSFAYAPTAAQAGMVEVVCDVQDADWHGVVRSVWTVNVHDPAPLVSPSVMTQGMEMVAYSETFTAQGGRPEYHWRRPVAPAVWGENTWYALNLPLNLDDVVALDVDQYKTLVLKQDGSVATWGSRLFPAEIPEEVTDVIGISAGRYHNLALLPGGRVAVWGNGTLNGVYHPPAPDSIQGEVSQVEASNMFSVALLHDGTVRVWGEEDWVPVRLELAPPENLEGIQAVTAGERHIVALHNDGTVSSWGEIHGNNLDVPAGLQNVVQVEACGHTTLALTAAGTVVAWGDNSFGQTDVPADLVGVRRVFAGDRVCAAQRENGEMVFWGEVSNPARQLPSAVTGDILDLGLGVEHAVALTNPQTVHGYRVSAGGSVTGVSRVAGDFTFPVAVEDLRGRVSRHNASLTIQPNPNLRPVIDSRSPGDARQEVRIPVSHLFEVNAHDPEGQTLTYQWSWNGELLPATQSSYTFESIGKDPQVGKLRCWVEDDLWDREVYTEWEVVVVPEALDLDIPSPSPELSRVNRALSLPSAGGVGSVRFGLAGKPVTWGNPAVPSLAVPNDLQDAVMVDGGGRHSLALRVDGSVVAWGENSAGQCDVPADLPPVIQVSAGGDFSLALLADGSVRAWGDNTNGQLEVPAGLKALQVSAGAGHALALRTDGSVVAWGDNTYGQSVPPADLPPMEFISAGKTQSAGVTREGVLRSWGGQAGDGGNLQTGVRTVAAGGTHNLVLFEDGTFGRYPLTTPWVNYLKPVPDADVISIAAGEDHSMLLLANGDVLIYGASDQWEQMVPPELDGVFTISAGDHHGLALTRTGQGIRVTAAGELELDHPDAGTVQATVVAVDRTGAVDWDGVSMEFLENPDLPPVPDTVLPLPGYFEIPASEVQVFEVDATDPESSELTFLWTWKGDVVQEGVGASTYTLSWSESQVGTGELRCEVFDTVQDDPLELVWTVRLLPPGFTWAGPAPADGVAGTPYQHPFQASGARTPVRWFRGGIPVIWAWEGNPLTVPEGLEDVVQLEGGSGFWIALRENGSLRGWGSNSQSQLNIPLDLPDVIQVAAGDGHVVALHADGYVTCWGQSDFGQSNTPVGLENVRSISAGPTLSVALLEDGSLRAWGALAGATLRIPEELTDVVQVDVGVDHVLALRADGSVQVLGRSIWAYAQVPEGLSDVVAMNAGSQPARP